MKNSLIGVCSLVALACAGSVYAAEVAGNNTAVVIQRAVTASSSGYQHLCVPVKALDITGGGNGTLTLSTVLPPASYAENATVIVSDGTNTATYTVKLASDGTTHQWQTSANVDADATVLNTGDILFLNSGSSTASTVFCGEENTTPPTITGSTALQTTGNSTSGSLTYNDLFANCANGSQLFRIESGNADYTVYQKIYGTWYNPITGAEITLSDLELSPGEALYFYAPSLTTTAQ